MFYSKKERRALSLNRKFYGDYIGLDKRPSMRLLIPKRENIEFAQTCNKYDRLFKRQKRDIILTNKAIYVIGREEVKEKNKPKSIVEAIKRRIDYTQIERIALSKMHDNFLVIYPRDDYASVIELEFKTEFLTTLTRRYKEAFGGKLFPITFHDEYIYIYK